MATRRNDIEDTLNRQTSPRTPNSEEDDAENRITADSLQPTGPISSGSDASLQRSTPDGNVGSRYERISDAAYRRAEQRGFAPGQELDDWLAAEREIDNAG
jgi:hypothetical protein